MLTDEECKGLLQRIEKHGENYVTLNKMCKQWNKNIMEDITKIDAIYKQIQVEFNVLKTPNKTQRKQLRRLQSDIEEIKKTMFENGCKTIFKIEEDCGDAKKLLNHRKK